MKTCLLCDRTEKSNLKDNLDFICSTCIQGLLAAGIEAIKDRYIKAVETGQWRIAKALHTFVPKNIRKQYPHKQSC